MPELSTAEQSAARMQAFFVAYLDEIKQNDFIARLWKKDATLWSDAPAHQKLIAESLGWLTAPETMLKQVDELSRFAHEIYEAGFTHAVVLGMGGSSLCPEVLRQCFGKQEDCPELLVLDSTVPDAVAAIEAQIQPATTLFLVASKSGSTTEPQMFQRYFFDRVKQLKGDKAGENFVAITDAGTVLEQQAKDDHYRRIFLNLADIGGRFSALSYFGMVPLAVMGCDVRTFLERAANAAQICRNEDLRQNPGATMGAMLATFAAHGVNKLTLLTAPELASVGLWIEQLVAESTGKDGKSGLVPVVGETIGDAFEYSRDRLFVALTKAGAPEDPKLALLKKASTDGVSFTVVHQQQYGAIDLGTTFFLWEFATAVACALLKIDAFDQPNVQESKDNTKKLLAEYVEKGALPEQKPLFSQDGLSLYSQDQTLGTTLDAAIRSLVGQVRVGDYFAILQFFAETPEAEALVQRLRLQIRRRTLAATTTGYGPRFLHSTGQLHKGGDDSGVFLQLTAADAHDLKIPGEPFGFSVLKQAQALGDYQSLLAHKRRVVRIDLGTNIVAGLERLVAAVEKI